MPLNILRVYGTGGHNGFSPSITDYHIRSLRRSSVPARGLGTIQGTHLEKVAEDVGHAPNSQSEQSDLESVPARLSGSSSMADATGIAPVTPSGAARFKRVSSSMPVCIHPK